MVIAPQFNYILIMLPIIIAPQIFKQYDALINNSYGRGKEHSKMGSPRDRGGLERLDSRLQYIFFETLG